MCVLDNSDAEAYDDILAPGGLNNGPAPSVGDDLGDYVPHEPQVKSALYSIATYIGQLATCTCTWSERN